MQNYKLLGKIGDGTFSEVIKGESVKTGQYVAIKCMKNHFDSIQQVKRNREIQSLKKLSPHPNIITLIQVLYDQPTGRLALVFQLMQQNFYETIRGKKTYLDANRVQFYMFQLMRALDYIHKKGIFHRDIKPENILISGDSVKLADFGSCKGIKSEWPYTEYISTRWYRAPECLLTDGYYGEKMDMWGAGCVMFEVLSLFPLFPGNDELDQVHQIHNVLGTPKPELLEKYQKLATHLGQFNFPKRKGIGLENLAPNIKPDAFALIYQMLAYDPEQRITAEDALKEPYFAECWETQYGRELLSTLNSIQLSPRSHPHNNTINSSKFSSKANGNNAASSNYHHSKNLKPKVQNPHKQYVDSQLFIGSNAAQIYTFDSKQNLHHANGIGNVSQNEKFNPFQGSHSTILGSNSKLGMVKEGSQMIIGGGGLAHSTLKKNYPSPYENQQAINQESQLQIGSSGDKMFYPHLSIKQPNPKQKLKKKPNQMEVTGGLPINLVLNLKIESGVGASSTYQNSLNNFNTNQFSSAMQSHDYINNNLAGSRSTDEDIRETQSILPPILKQTTGEQSPVVSIDSKVSHGNSFQPSPPPQINPFKQQRQNIFMPVQNISNSNHQQSQNKQPNQLMLNSQFQLHDSFQGHPIGAISDSLYLVQGKKASYAQKSPHQHLLKKEN